MKKVFISIVLLLGLSFSNAFAYTPTLQDSKILQKVENRIEKLSMEQLQSLEGKINSIREQKYRGKDNKMTYLLGAINDLIKKKISAISILQFDKKVLQEQQDLEEKIEKLNRNYLDRDGLLLLTNLSFDRGILTQEDKDNIRKELHVSQLSDLELLEKEYEIGNKLNRSISNKYSKEWYTLNFEYEIILLEKLVRNNKKIGDSIRGCYFLDVGVEIRYINENNCENLELPDIKESYGPIDGGKLYSRKYNYKDNLCYTFTHEGIKNYVNADKYCKYEKSIAETKEKTEKIRQEKNEADISAYTQMIEKELANEIERITQRAEERINTLNTGASFSGFGRSSYVNKRREEIQSNIEREIEMAKMRAQYKIDLYKMEIENNLRSSKVYNDLKIRQAQRELDESTRKLEEQKRKNKEDFEKMMERYQPTNNHIYYIGPRGGCYYKSTDKYGRYETKVYVDRSYCY